MSMRVSFSAAAAILLVGAACVSVIPGGGGGSGSSSGGFTTPTPRPTSTPAPTATPVTSRIPLFEADVTITIAHQTGGATEAAVTAVIEDSAGDPVELGSGQAIAVNDVALSGGAGEYTGSVAVAATYKVTVLEPSRGALDTTIDALGDFAVTSPASGGEAPLSDFVVTWSNPDAELNVTIAVEQTLFDEPKRLTYGPFSDDGTRALTVEDLNNNFQQGADLTITVTKFRQQDEIDGVASGTLKVELAKSVTATPGT